MSHYAGRAARRVSAVAGRLITITLLALAVLMPGAAHAQALPAGWATANVGAAAPAGAASYASATFTIDGGGADVWDPSDQFFYAYRKITGDVTIVARVAAVENTHAWAKAGVMIRESLTATSRHAFALVSPVKGIAFQRRTATGGTSTNTGVAGTAPVWLRLQRAGSTITAAHSTNGTTWTNIATSAVPIGAAAYVGLAVTSHNSSTLATAKFTNVSVTTPAALPAGWSVSDVGSPAVKGSATGTTAGAFTVKGAGTDVWGTSDQFTYAWKQVSGDVDVVARVGSIAGTQDWSKGGVMVRSSLAANSAHATLFASKAKGVAFQRRPAAGAQSLNTAGGAVPAPVWLKLERRGSAVTAFRSTNGTSWTLIDSQTLTLPSTFYVGLAVTNHDAAALATASFTNVAVAAPAATTPTPPVVSLTAPAAGATFTAPASMTVSATASDANGTVAKVDFYAGTTLIGSDTTSPYSVTWSNVPAGSYALTAVAEDDSGARTTSAAHAIVVNAASTIPGHAKFVPSGDHATSKVTNYQLDVFTAGANPATAAPIATQDVGKPGVVNGECTVDISALVNGLPGGSYFATVMAVGPGGASPRTVSASFTR